MGQVNKKGGKHKRRDLKRTEAGLPGPWPPSGSLRLDDRRSAPQHGANPADRRADEIRLGDRQLAAARVLGDCVGGGELVASISKEQKRRVAVVPFRELSNRETVLGSYIAEALTTALFKQNLRIVERALLDRVMGELKLGTTGAIDPDSAKKIGKLAGVEALVTGTITDLQSYVSINSRMIDTETGEVFSAAETRILKDADVLGIMGRSVANSATAPSNPAPAASAPAPESPKAVMSAAAEGFLFDLRECTRASRLVRCTLLITKQDAAARGGSENHERAANLVLIQTARPRGETLGGRGSRGGNVLRLRPDLMRAIDSNGIEHLSSLVRLGNTIWRKGRGSSFAVDMIPSVPMKGEIEFDGVGSDVTNFAVVEIVIANSGYGSSGVQFRNVSIS